ncbi:MAG TPA: M20/M25/M40 family metallo-hydrolase [Phycisphaerae bacterium]|nr:M20/M25/M40 family metallo-hydrolase [Phycisphaerae bacterium]HRW51246.1 M20/M25/M40 family metallo-hydrolase [Phycisphaerae bacterium]
MRRSIRRGVGVCLAFACLFAVPTVGVASDRHSTDESLYSAEQYVGWIDYLASDDLEGRGTGQEGIDKAGDYIASVWESFGVEPAGDDDSYFQNFQLALSNRIGDRTRLAIGTDGRLTRKPAILNEEFVPLPFSSSESFSGDVVFVGYGISDSDYDDYAGIDVKDKVVLMLRRGPGFGYFGMRQVSFRAKSLTAKDHGAAAVLIVNPDGESELFDFRQGGRGGDHGIPMMHITPDLATRMLAAGGLQDIQTLQHRIEDKQAPASAALDGVSVRGCVDIEPIQSDVRNVVGRIPGSGPQKDEIIVLGAHYDHLGIRHKGEPEFNPAKDISNGADDNASGTAMLMQFAKAYTKGASPNRTIVLVAFTGEELGLLGSAHFAKTPSVDLDKCVAMLNFDMVGRLKDNMLEVGGMRTGGFEEMVRDLAKSYDFDIRDGGGGRGPSDHTNFYLRDIPVLFFFTGLHKQYHQPEDDTPLINSHGAMKIARFAADVFDAIDGAEAPPAFAKDSRRANIGRQSDSSPPSNRPTDDRPLAGPRTGAPVQLGVTPSMIASGEGLLIESVTEGSPAARADLRPGDRIVRIGKTRTNSVEDALKALGELKTGDSTQVRIVRAGQRQTVRVQFGEKPKPAERPAKPRPEKPDKPTKKPAPDKAKPQGDAVQAICSQIDSIVSKDSTLGSGGLSISRSNEAIEIKATIHGEARSAADLDALLRTIEDALKSAMGPAARRANFRIDGESTGHPAGSIRVSISIRISRSGGPAHKTDAGDKPRRKGAGRGADGPRGANRRAATASTRNPHGDAHDNLPDDVENNTRPPVRLGVQPIYGQSDGEGFEIAGVVEGGPAERSGMKDDDRILSIGGHDVWDVYSYMEALRKCRPGDKIKVVVLRKGERVELTVVSAPPRVEEAA